MSIILTVKGLIKSTLKTYFKLRNKGVPHQQALKLMIGTRYPFEKYSDIRDLLWGIADECFAQTKKDYADLPVELGTSHRKHVVKIIAWMYLFKNKFLFLEIMK
jgi:hypothetical protein